MKVSQSCLTLCDPWIYSPWDSPGQNTIVGILSLIQGSSQPTDRTQVSSIAGRFFISWVTREARRIREGNFKMMFFFFFAISSRGSPTYRAFFAFLICFKCPTTIEWLMLGSSAASHVAVRGSALTAARSLSLSASGAPQMPLIFRALISFANLLETLLPCLFLSSSWPEVWLMLWVVSAALWLILNSNKKITQICSFSNIISMC